MTILETHGPGGPGRPSAVLARGGHRPKEPALLEAIARALKRSERRAILAAERRMDLAAARESGMRRRRCWTGWR